MKQQDFREDIYISELYRKLLGREPDAEGLAHYMRCLEQGELTQGEVVRHLKNSSEYRLRRFPGEIPRRALENSTLNDREIREKKTVLSSRPITFNIDLIGVCNMTPPCSMCINWENGIGPRHHKGMTIGDIESFGEHLQMAAEVINCGIGEPLLNRDFIPILRLFHDWGKPFGFNSNGLALTPAMTDRLAPYFEILTIIFSLDAATAGTYAKIRGAHFDRVIDNIARYTAKRREMDPDGYASKTGLVFMPMRSNRREISDFIRLGARLGVDVVELRALNQIGKNWIVRRGDFVFDYLAEILSPGELEKVRQEAAETAKAEGVRLDCQYQVSPENTFSFFLPPHYKGLGIHCILPWRFILPYQNGDTVPCCFIGKDLGDWRKVGLEKIWNGEIMQTLRAQMAGGGLPDLCRNSLSCPVVQAALAEKNEGRNDAGFSKHIAHDGLDLFSAPPALRTRAPQKIGLLRSVIRGLRNRFNRELEHSFEPRTERQERINHSLFNEIERLREELEKLRSPDGKPKS